MFSRAIASSVRALLFAAVVGLLPRAAAAEPIKTDLTIDTSQGYARIVFNFAEPNEADVRMSSGVLVISFKNPIDVDVSRVSSSNDYVSASRRDPDGRGVRLALKQKVRVSSMVAGERFFVDLLPDSWTAAPPPLPKEVVEDLARRAREAERRIQQRQGAKPRAQVSRVRVSPQPTFTRYTFELPDFIAVTAERDKELLTLSFDGALRFDLSEAMRALPPVVQSIETSGNETATSVVLSLVGKVDVRAFREDGNYVVDIVTAEPGGRPAQTALPPPGSGLPSLPAVEGKPPNRLPLSLPGRVESKTEPPHIAAAAPVAAAPAAPPAQPVPPAVSAAPPPAMQPAASAMQATPAGASRSAAATLPAASPVAAPQEPPARAADALETKTREAGTSAPGAAEFAASESKAPASKAPESGTPETKALATASKAEPNPATPVSAAPRTDGAVVMELQPHGDSLRLSVPFPVPTSAAVFARADTLWLVFDTDAAIDTTGIAHELIREAVVTRTDGAQIVRLRLERPRLISASVEDNAWVINIADAVVTPAQPLAVMRNVGTPRPSAHVPFDQPARVHRLQDPGIGDTLFVATAKGPARGIAKAQDFVDFRALVSAHGVVVQPVADDLRMELAADRIIIGRPNGLTLTSAAPLGQRNGIQRAVMFDAQQWGFDRQADFLGRSISLITAASQTADAKRTNARLELARFYFARDMYPEAKAVLDVVLSEDSPNAEDTAPLVMRGVAKILMGRPEDGLKDINDPLVGNQNDAQIWRALAAAEQGKWAEAREGFRKTETALGMLPIELQRKILMEAIRASIELGDFASAANQLNDYETLSVPPEAQPALSVLAGRIHEGLGRGGDALIAYRAAADSSDRAAAAQGRLRELVLRFRSGDVKRAEVIADLETLTAVWRGDETEIEALSLLARLYTEEGRYRDAFNVMRIAARVHPNSEMTRAIHDEAAATFDKLFLGGKIDALPAIEALSLFYDFRELVPIGRRGDEMIRRLTDRLVMVDLLDQAAELLQHQIDHRLEGAARAQVAIRLAAVYLMNRKPERAIQVIRATRMNELSNEIRNQRLLLEARALSDTGRPSLALEVIEHVEGGDAIRARSDILWAAKRFREAAEQIELLYGERWRDWTPLNDNERREILRAALGYNLGEDQIGLDRLKEKFGPAMLQSTDRRAFEVVTAPLQGSDEEFRDVARAIAATDTLDRFLRDIRARNQEISRTLPGQRPAAQLRRRDADPAPTGSLRAIASR